MSVVFLCAIFLNNNNNNNKCVSEGLMHVAAWYCGTLGPKFTKFEEVSNGQTITLPNFIAFGQTIYEKRVIIFYPRKFWRP